MRGKREDEDIPDPESEQLPQLTDRAEELHAERMAAPVELAQLQGLGYDDGEDIETIKGSVLPKLRVAYIEVEGEKRMSASDAIRPSFYWRAPL